MIARYDYFGYSIICICEAWIVYEDKTKHGSLASATLHIDYKYLSHKK
jgi:hypothetical protein